ncbi:hypothetical protein WJX75_006062 [Coccomyxa subellipsoidea]|uniref:SCP domain-containing protein n=1 Tax=Coccomyxa subellipsoidea TaxID=248742 RepID=A0ABR2Z1W6_9CHLO
MQMKTKPFGKCQPHCGHKLVISFLQYRWSFSPVLLIFQDSKLRFHGLTLMKRILAAATLTLLFAAFTAEALTPTPIDAQPYGPVTAAQVPAAAATCKAALDAANKALTASNGDFTAVIQPNGATAENNEYLYCSTADSTAGQHSLPPVMFYNWDLINHTKAAPTTLKYDLLELIVVGVNKYACGCGYKVSTMGSYGI